jgi:hypothetical protein
MSDHRYILEPYKGMKTRHICPSCRRSDKTFTLYIDTETGEHINPRVGRCNREINCNYHYTPRQYFQDNHISEYKPQMQSCTKPNNVSSIEKQISFIPVEVFKKSLQIDKNVSQVAEVNHFVKFLTDLFGDEKAHELLTRYFIGTSKYWNGATVFWQIDISGIVRTGKIMLYNSTTGKRVKEPFNHINWVHTAMKILDFELKQCLFGEHLLQDKTKPVAIVESEKTAVIASAYLPEFIWLAAGSLTNLNIEKCNVLKGRMVTLFPDLKCFEKWSLKTKELSTQLGGTILNVSDLLERKANEAEKMRGFDLADYLVKFNYKDFIFNSGEPLPKQVEKKQKLVPVLELHQPKSLLTQNYLKVPERLRIENWEQEITELEGFFNSIILPTEPIKINKWSTITNVTRNLESEFATVKANNGNRTFLPALNRLKELKEYLTAN